MNNESDVKPEIHVGDTLEYVGPTLIYRGGRLRVIAVNDVYVWGVSGDPQFVTVPRDSANNIVLTRSDLSYVSRVDVQKRPTSKMSVAWNALIGFLSIVGYAAIIWLLVLLWPIGADPWAWFYVPFGVLVGLCAGSFIGFILLIIGIRLADVILEWRWRK